MPLFFPTLDAHYLTKDYDAIDSICLDYYGTSSLTTELVLRRNPSLAEEQPLLPGGMVIVLPAITESLFARDARSGLALDFIQALNGMDSASLRAYLAGNPLAGSSALKTGIKVLRGGQTTAKKTQNSVPLWDYTKRAANLYVPTATTEAQDAQTALEAYRKLKAAAVASGSGGGGSNPSIPSYGSTSDDCCSNPLLLDDFEYFAVYYRDQNAKWRLGRIHKRNMKINTDGYGHTVTVTSAISDPLANGLL